MFLGVAQEMSAIILSKNSQMDWVMSLDSLSTCNQRVPLPLQQKVPSSGEHLEHLLDLSCPVSSPGSRKNWKRQLTRQLMFSFHQSTLKNGN